MVFPKSQKISKKAFYHGSPLRYKHFPILSKKGTRRINGRYPFFYKCPNTFGLLICFDLLCFDPVRPRPCRIFLLVISGLPGSHLNIIHFLSLQLIDHNLIFHRIFHLRCRHIFLKGIADLIPFNPPCFHINSDTFLFHKLTANICCRYYDLLLVIIIGNFIVIRIRCVLIISCCYI